MISNLASEKIWTDKSRFDQAESKYHQLASKDKKSASTNCCNINGKSAINKNEIDVNTVINTSAIDVAANNQNDDACLAQIKTTKNKKINKQKQTNANTNAIANENDENTTEVNNKVNNKKNRKKLQKILAKQQALEWKQQVWELKQEVEHLKLQVGSEAGDKLVVTTTDTKVATMNSADNLCSLVAKAKGSCSNNQGTLVSEIAKAREHIKNSLEKMDGIATLASSSTSGEVLDRIGALEKDNNDLRKLVEQLRAMNLESQKRISALEASIGKTATVAAVVKTAEKAKAAAADDDDDVDLFASEDEEEDSEAAALREKRLAAYAEKKSKKPALIAKSSLVLDVKPWDDETDLKVMETEIRKITADGLLWGASKFAPVAFGIQKLTISCVVEDDKISIDWLTEEIEKLEDYVQSVDVAAFNKI